MKKYRLAAVIVLVFGIVGALCYFYYRNTPAYSLFLIWRAAVSHDLAAFEERVDLDSALAHAFDEIVGEAGKDMPVEGKRLAKGLAGLFKQAFVTAAKERIRERVRAAPPATGHNGQAGSGDAPFNIPSQKSIVRGIADRFSPGKVDYKGTGATKAEGVVANVEILIFDHELKKNFTLTAKLEKTERGVWRLTQIKDFVPYFLERFIVK